MSATPLPLLRRMWCRSHGLGTTTATAPQGVLQQTGWVRTLGGIDAYLSLTARCPTLTVDAIHAALADGSIEVVPAARGCIYLVPTSDAPLARALARDLSARRNARDRKKAGLGDDELNRVQQAILDTLHTGPATTAQLRSRVPEGTIRSLGAAGKKVGLSSSLPPAIRELEFSGRIVRRCVDHRLDHEQYVWHLAPEGSIDPRPVAERTHDLLVGIVGWLGPATVDELAAFTGLGKRAVHTAMQQADFTWIDTAAGPAATRQPISTDPDPTPYALPGLDPMLSVHGGVSAFVLPADADRPVARWGRQKGDTWGTINNMISRAFIVDGVVAGAWEADPDSRSIEVLPFSSGLPDTSQTVARLQSLIWTELGHARAFSIDSEDRIRKRRDLLRAHAGQ